MKALASPPLILFIVVAVARYIVPLVSFFRVSTQNCFWHVGNRSNRFAGGRLFTMNDLPQVKCNLYHSYSRWCRKSMQVFT